ncbi:MAG: NosD domain-containing protein [Candidatus Lokiarchaeota archaeon]|jgi:parallel beta-helix repeat protein
MNLLERYKANFVIISFFSWLILFNLLTISLIPTNFNPESQSQSLKMATYWEVSDEIHINNNWSASEVVYDFIQGSGVYNDPYIIENITIKNLKNGNDVIKIENTQDYFIIRNCKIFDSGASIYNSEINLINSSKGTLFNNTLSSNVGTGISLVKCHNISIIENILFNNTYVGIGLNQSYDNFILHNNANYQGKDASSGFGLSLYKSHNNSISENSLSYNSAIGILLANSSNNNVTFNSAQHNYLGLHLTQNSNYNYIIHNDLRNNEYCYTVDNDSEGNILEDNDCGGVGVEFYFFLIAFGIVFTLALIGFIIALKRRRKLKKQRKELQT